MTKEVEPSDGKQVWPPGFGTKEVEPSVKDDVAAVRLAMGYAAKGTVSSGGSVRPNGLAAFDRILQQLQEAEERARTQNGWAMKLRVERDAAIAEKDEWKRGAEAAYAANDATMAQLQEAEERAADWKTKAWANNYTREASDRALTEVMAERDAALERATVAERAAASKIGPDWREALPYESELELTSIITHLKDQPQEAEERNKEDGIGWGYFEGRTAEEWAGIAAAKDEQIEDVIAALARWVDNDPSVSPGENIRMMQDALASQLRQKDEEIERLRHDREVASRYADWDEYDRMRTALRGAEAVVDAVLDMIDPGATAARSVDELRNTAIAKAVDHRQALEQPTQEAEK